MFRTGRATTPRLPGLPVISEADHHLIDLRKVVKTSAGTAGTFTALRGVDLQVDPAEFVAVIGKSGGGKTTLIYMITGIDSPTSGVVYAGTPVHALTEGQLAEWRGRAVGIVFQFFQLLPTLSLVENIMLPMDFAGVCSTGDCSNLHQSGARPSVRPRRAT